jgi:hypothetical protein
MWIVQEPKKVALWNKRHFEEKNGECAACLKYTVLTFVEKIYKMEHLVGSGTPVLYIGRKVKTPFSRFWYPKKLHNTVHLCVALWTSSIRTAIILLSSKHNSFTPDFFNLLIRHRLTFLWEPRWATLRIAKYANFIFSIYKHEVTREPMNQFLRGFFVDIF